MPRRQTEGLNVLVWLRPSFNIGTRCGWVVNATPRPLYPGKEPPHPLYRSLGGPQGRYGRVRKFSPLQGFEHRTVQSEASRYTDYAIPDAILGYTSSLPNFTLFHEWFSTEVAYVYAQFYVSS